MLESIDETSPRFKGRMAGVFQGLEGLTFTFGQVIVLGKLLFFTTLRRQRPISSDTSRCSGWGSRLA
jgi:hypothetical protein